MTPNIPLPKVPERFKPDNMDKDTKKKLTVFLVALMFITLAFVAMNLRGPRMLGYETGEATIDDLLYITSEFNIPPEEMVFVVSDSDPLYALIATPASVHYGENVSIRPQVVIQGTDGRYPYPGVSNSVKSFITMYQSRNTTAMVLGDAQYTELAVSLQGTPMRGSPAEVSLKFAEMFWEQSDAVVLVENSKWGYAEAVNTVPLASYLGIPVIVADSMNEDVASLLKDLDVRFSIVCGGIGGYGRTLRYRPTAGQLSKSTGQSESWVSTNMRSQTVQRHIADHHQTLMADALTKVIRMRIGGDVNYITMANPADAWPIEKTGESLRYSFDGHITDSGATAYPGAAPIGAEGPTHEYSVPYKYANVRVDVRMDVTEATGPLWSYFNPSSPIEKNADGSGERIYAYLGVDLNEDGVLDTSDDSDELRLFGGSPGYDFIRANPTNPQSTPLWAHFYIELPFYNEATDNHLIQLLGRLPTVPSASAYYTVDIVVEEIADPVYPLMNGLSSMAPYLTAYRMGVILAKERYHMYTPQILAINGSGIAPSNLEVAYEVNSHIGTIKSDLNDLLARLAGKEEYTQTSLADHYRELSTRPNSTMHLALMADTNMIPMYYYESNSLGQDSFEGFGIPGDNIYMDIDADINDAPFNVEGGDASLEIASGRVVGWNVQDVSALLARNAFYERIIEYHRGPKNSDLPIVEGALGDYWKNSGVTSLGTVPPIASAFPTAQKLSTMWEAAGMSTNTRPWGLKNQMSRRQYAQPFYESGNFVYVCAHGFYYWYVPTAQEGYLGVMEATGSGGAFDIAHVKDMKFGPSVTFLSSCVTGRIDGIPGRHALSQAFLHGGMNAYIGATRMSWGSLVPIPDDTHGESLGDLLALYTYASMTGYIYNKDSGLAEGWIYSDTSVGFALMTGKNLYLDHQGGTDGGGTVSDTFFEFVLHGDPAFNPYIPSPGPAAD